ncbi:MAG: hypothetical protein ACLSH6_08115 [Limosilactobacillus pontis]
MTQASTVNVYRLMLNNKYGWIASAYPDDQFDKAINRQISKAERQTQPLTEIQQALLTHGDEPGVTHQLIDR